MAEHAKGCSFEQEVLGLDSPSLPGLQAVASFRELFSVSPSVGLSLVDSRIRTTVPPFSTVVAALPSCCPPIGLALGNISPYLAFQALGGGRAESGGKNAK